MPLDFQLVRLNMTEGVARDTDDFISLPAKPRVLNNAVFEDSNTLIIRGGVAPLTLTPLSGYVNVEMIRRLSKNGRTLLIEAESGLHSYDASAEKTRNYSGGMPGAPFSRAELFTSPVSAIGSQPTTSATAGAFGQYAYDSDQHDGYSVFAWEERDQSNGKRVVKYQVILEATKQVVFEGTRSGSDFYSQPRVVAVPDEDLIFVYYLRYPSGTGVYNISRIAFDTSVATVSAEADVAVATAVTMGASTANMYLFDAVLGLNDDVILTFRTPDNGDDSFALARVFSSDGVSDNGSVVINTSGDFDQLSLVATGVGLGARYVVAYGVDDAVYGAWSNFELAISSAETVLINCTASTSVGRVTMVINDDTPTVFTLFADNSLTTTGAYPSPITDEQQIVGAVYTNNFALHGFFQFNVESFLFGRAAFDGSRYLLPVFYPSKTEGAAYLLDVTGVVNEIVFQTFTNVHIVATLGWGECGGMVDQWTPQLRLAGGFTYQGLFTQPFGRYAPDLQLLAGVTTTPTFLNRADLNFSSRNIGAVEFHGVTYLAGATPQMFDGAVFCEQGFTHAPRIVSAAGAGAGSPLAAGTYNFCATIAWQDARGNVHESAPSTVKTVTITANQYVVPTFGTFGLTNKVGAYIRLYRTVESGSVFYLEDRTLGNNNLSDVNIVKGDQLYTTGGVPPNEMMQPARVMCEHQQRMVWIGEDGHEVFFSQTIDKGFGPGVVSNYVRAVPADWGRAVGIVSMDEKLVVIGEKQIGFFYGTGPTLAGAQDSYSELVVALSDFGAEWDSPLSVAKSGDFVWFNSPYGLRAVTRGLSIAVNGERELGSEIDDLTSSDPSIRTLVSSAKQQTRFLGTLDGVAAWVWDKIWNQWSTFDNHRNVDCIVVNDVYTFASNQGVFQYGDDIPFESPGSPAIMVETPWISFAGVQGFQRVSHLMFLAKAQTTAGPLAVLLQTKINYIDQDATEGRNIVPVPSPNDTEGSPTNMYQFEVQLTRQTCEAMKLIIIVQATESRIRLSNIVFRVGIKRGRFKAAQRL